MILGSLEVQRPEFERRTGWAIRPEGACKGEVCVPLRDDVSRSATGDAGATLDAHVVASALGMPLVGDEDHGIWALGPESGVTGRALTTARAPDLELPDLDGNPFALSSLLGQKVLLIAWASW